MSAGTQKFEINERPVLDNTVLVTGPYEELVQF